MKKMVSIILVSGLMFNVGCTWVKLDKGARQVSVVKTRYVKNCEYLGMVSGKVFTGAVGISRSNRKINEEIQTIARNNATDMGGDSIVIASPIREGRQKFKVYRCGR